MKRFLAAGCESLTKRRKERPKSHYILEERRVGSPRLFPCLLAISTEPVVSLMVPSLKSWREGNSERGKRERNETQTDKQENNNLNISFLCVSSWKVSLVINRPVCHLEMMAHVRRMQLEREAYFRMTHAPCVENSWRSLFNQWVSVPERKQSTAAIKKSTLNSSWTSL